MSPSPEISPHHHDGAKPITGLDYYPPHHWLQSVEPLELKAGDIDQDLGDHVEPGEFQGTKENEPSAIKLQLMKLGRKALKVVQSAADYGDRFDHDAHPKVVEIIHDKPAPPENSATTAERAYITERIEKQHFVKQAPYFNDIVHDDSRSNLFTYVAEALPLYNRNPSSDDTLKTVTEHEGLNQLHDFLSDFLQSQIKAGDGDGVLAREAKGMLDNLTFIGEKEYAEGARGLASLWKSYLDEHPENQLCVPTKISKQGGMRKSDIHLFENIMNSFSDEELDHYGGRIVTDIDQITQRPSRTRIVLLDDWTISGSQMRNAYSAVKADKGFRRYADRIEINLLVASENRLRDGLSVENWSTDGDYIPVKAYYKAHDASATSGHEHKAHVTGTHSSVDFDFEVEIDSMRRKLEYTQLPREDESWITPPMPPLSNIVRTYRYAEPLIRIERGGRIVRNKV